MAETMRRRISIAQEWATWSDALPGLLRKLDVVLELPNLTATQRLDIDLIAARIGSVFVAIGLAVDADASCERLLATMDRLREEITAADATLDGLLKPLAS
jgi:hypothetical protein